MIEWTTKARVIGKIFPKFLSFFVNTWLEGIFFFLCKNNFGIRIIDLSLISERTLRIIGLIIKLVWSTATISSKFGFFKSKFMDAVVLMVIGPKRLSFIPFLHWLITFHCQTIKIAKFDKLMLYIKKFSDAIEVVQLIVPKSITTNAEFELALVGRIKIGAFMFKSKLIGTIFPSFTIIFKYCCPASNCFLYFSAIWFL